MNPWKFILATVLIFGTGVVTGALVVDLSRRSDPPKPPTPLTYNQVQRADFLNRLQRQLHLTSDQNERIGRLLRESNERTRPWWDPVAAKMKDEVTAVREKISAELTAEQRLKFDSEVSKPRTPKKADDTMPRKDRPKFTGTNAPSMKPSKTGQPKGKLTETAPPDEKN